MGVISAALEIGVVPGLQGIGSERVGEGRLGQDGDKESVGPSGLTHTYLEKLNLLKVMVFLMNSVKFSAWTSRGSL